MTTEDRPRLQLLRSDVVLELRKDGYEYTLRIAKLCTAPETLENLTAEQALDKLAEELKSDA